MTKDKTNDFIKIKQVKIYCVNNNIKISLEQTLALKELVKLHLDSMKTQTPKEEPKKEGFVDKLTSVANDLNNSVGDLVNKF